MNPTSEIFNRLLKDRIIILGTDVNDDIANIICAQMLFLEGEDDAKDIWLYINSPGGSVTAGMAIYDTMQFVEARRGHDLHGPGRLDGPVPALRRRSRASASPCPHARIMMHQPSGGIRGQASDIAIQAEQLIYIKRLMAERIAHHSGQTVEQIQLDSERDRWFTADQAKDYGLIDHVIVKRGRDDLGPGPSALARRSARSASAAIRSGTSNSSATSAAVIGSTSRARSTSARSSAGGTRRRAVSRRTIASSRCMVAAGGHGVADAALEVDELVGEQRASARRRVAAASMVMRSRVAVAVPGGALGHVVEPDLEARVPGRGGPRVPARHRRLRSSGRTGRRRRVPRAGPGIRAAGGGAERGPGDGAPRSARGSASSAGAQALDRLQREVALAPLDAAHEGAVDGEGVGEGLLGEPPLLAEATQVAPELPLQVAFHGRDRRSLLLQGLQTDQ